MRIKLFIVTLISESLSKTIVLNPLKVSYFGVETFVWESKGKRLLQKPAQDALV